jgi:predicted transport protein
MLTEDSLKEAVEISQFIVNYKQKNTAQEAFSNYSNDIKPQIVAYEKKHGNTPNLLYKGQLDEINNNSSLVVEGRVGRFYGNYVINNHAWNSLFIKGGDPKKNPHLYILNNEVGIKYGIDYGNDINDLGNIFIQRVKSDSTILTDILNLLNTNNRIKLYNIESGSPGLPLKGSEILINNISDIENNWTNQSHLIGVIEYANITSSCGVNIEKDLKQLFPIYEKICFPNQGEQGITGSISGEAKPVANQNNDEVNISNKVNETAPKYHQCNDIEKYIIGKPRNKIYYGAPGTGKSFKLRDTVLNELQFPEKNIKRVTFHPSYSYQQFVGSYKPTPIYRAIDDNVFGLYESNKVKQLISPHNKEPLIDYSFVPGPFLELLIAAILADKNNSKCNFMLIIEEINRANVASVFGDVFQLLDRNDDGSSEYHITFNTDIRNYLISKGIDEEEIKLPSNFFVWATMNNADQGVMPLDSAFKRRWAFEYIGINDAEIELNSRPIKFQNKCLEWNSFRKQINLTLKGKVTEDKLLGPFFMSKTELISSEAVKNKLLLYLREDVLRHNPEDLFAADLNTFSEISEAYDDKSLRNIFKANFDWAGITVSDKCPEEVDSEGFIKENYNEKEGKERPAKTIDEHFAGTTPEFRNIFNELKEKIEKFGSDVRTRTTYGQIIFEDETYFASFYVSKNKDRIRVELRPTNDQFHDPKQLTKIIKTLTSGNSTRSLNIDKTDLLNNLYTLDDVLKLIKQAYESKK